MRAIAFATLWTLLLAVEAAGADEAFADYTEAQRLRVEAREAYRDDDLDAAATAFARAADLRPDHPGIWRNLAVIQAERGNSRAAAAAFRHVANLGIALDGEAQTYFNKLPESGDKQAAAAEFERSNRRIGDVSQLDVAIPEDIRLVEDLAYDGESDRLYLSSVVNQAVYARQGRAFRKVFDLKEMSLGSPLGLSLDHERQRLWVAFSNVPQTPEPDRDQRTGLLLLDARTGEHLGTFIPEDSSAHAVNDVTHHPDGRVFAADGKGGAIFVVEDGEMAVLSDRPNIVSAQGLAVDDSGQVLYVADYSRGIHRIGLSGGDHAFMSTPDDDTLLGLDGLTFSSGDLIASRNGTNPKRFIAIELTDDGRKIEQVRSLAANLESTADPSLLTRVDGQVWAVGVSGWAQFGEGGRRVAGATPTPARLISLTVDD